jgi:hypothetical protein
MYAVTTTDPVQSTLLTSESFEDEDDAVDRWIEIVDEPVMRHVAGQVPTANTRVNLIKINGRARTLLASVDIYLPRGQA